MYTRRFGKVEIEVKPNTLKKKSWEGKVKIDGESLFIGFYDTEEKAVKDTGRYLSELAKDLKDLGY